MTETLLSPDYIFETSWEVCNKVGGIYAALSTRARTLVAEYKNNLIFLGPDLLSEMSNPCFQESASLYKEWKKEVNDILPIKIRIGRWNIPGKPVAILIDYRSYFSIKNEIYAEFWKGVLEPCLQMMKSGKNEEVREFYKKAIEELKSAHLS